MSEGSYSGDEVVNTEEDAARIKSDIVSPRWHANLWPDVPAAIDYANRPPLSQAGTIIFNIRDNGQVWTYDLH
jgi:hypothetical protein